MTERSFVTDDGVTIRYDEIGPRTGVPVVLCHGLAAAARQFAGDAAFFGGLGYRVLVPDLRGHGRSGRPARGRPADYTIGRMAADLVGMLDDAGVQQVHWVGTSLGGILALSLVGAHAARLRTQAAVGPGFAVKQAGFAAGAIPLTYRLLGQRLTAKVTAWQTTRNLEARSLIAEVLAGFDPAVGKAVAANLVRYDLLENARTATVPILLLRGGRDHNVNMALRRTLPKMQGLPHFTLIELPEGGHCANLDATGMLRRELLRFWERAA